jgi:hypothetical protein
MRRIRSHHRRQLRADRMPDMETVRQHPSSHDTADARPTLPHLLRQRGQRHLRLMRTRLHVSHMRGADHDNGQSMPVLQMCRQKRRSVQRVLASWHARHVQMPRQRQAETDRRRMPRFIITREKFKHYSLRQNEEPQHSWLKS